MFPAKKLSSAEAIALLSLRRLPGRLTSGEAAVFLGFEEHDLPVLIAAKLLAPLGKPSANSPKHFSSTVIEIIRGDEKWLSRATLVIAKNWQLKNSRKVNPTRLTHNNAKQAQPTEQP